MSIFSKLGSLFGEAQTSENYQKHTSIDAEKPVQPVMLRYLRDGSRYDDITFLPDENFVANFIRLFMQKSCVADVHVLPLIDTSGKQRRQVAGEAENAVREAFNSEIPSG